MRVLDAGGDTDLYCRLSKEQKEKVGSVALQERNLIKECRRLGLTPRAVHVDDGISASVYGKVRPGFLDLVAAIKDGDCKNVIAVDMDRFSRQNGEWAELLYRAGTAGVRLFARGTEIDAADPNDVLVATILGAVATTDSKLKGRKVKDAHAEIAERGTFHGGPRPFGYLKDGVTPDEAHEAPLYRELIKRISTGESPSTIAADWLERGITGPRGTVFNTPRLRYLVFSPRHSGQKVRAGKPNGLAAWPGLVTPEEQARAQAMFRNRLVVRAQRGTGRAALGLDRPLLQGIAHCALCKTKLVLNRRHSRNYYRCPSTGGGACGGVLVNADYADDEVEQQFLARLTRPKVQRELAKQQAAAPEVGSILERIDKIDGDLAMTHDMLDADEIGRDEYRRRIKDLKAKREACEQDLAASSLPVAITTDPKTLCEKWDSLDVDEKRANLVAMLERVEITKHVGPNRKVWNPDRVIPLWRDRRS